MINAWICGQSVIEYLYDLAWVGVCAFLQPCLDGAGVRASDTDQSLVVDANRQSEAVSDFQLDTTPVTA
jgi:hypothetical protein